MNSTTLPGSPQVEESAERLLRALSNVERLPLLHFLAQPRTVADIRREFPAVLETEVRRSLSLLESAGWLVGAGAERRQRAWKICSKAVPAVVAWLMDLVPTAKSAPRFSAEQFTFEIVVLRRATGRTVLRAVQSGITIHAELVEAACLQSGSVSNTLGRLEIAGLLEERRIIPEPELHLLRFLEDLQENFE